MLKKTPEEEQKEYDDSVDAADDLDDAAKDLDDADDDLNDAEDDLHLAADDLEEEVTFNFKNQDDDEITFKPQQGDAHSDESRHTRHNEIQELVFNHCLINLPEHLMLPRSWPGWMFPEERQDGYLNLDNAARADGSYP